MEPQSGLQDRMRQSKEVIMEHFTRHPDEDWKEVSVGPIVGKWRDIQGEPFQFRAEITCAHPLENIAAAVMDPKWQLTWDPNLIDVKLVNREGSTEVREYIYSTGTHLRPVKLQLGYICSMEAKESVLLSWSCLPNVPQECLEVLPSGLLFEKSGAGQCRCKMFLQLRGTLQRSVMRTIGVEFLRALMERGCHPDPNWIMKQ